jgi:type IV pilus assembly protein PilB
VPLLRSKFNVRDKLGECLRETGVISDADLGKALAEQRRKGERLGVILVRLGLVTEEQLARTLAAQLGFRYVSLTEDPPAAAVVSLIPKPIALQLACIAVGRKENVLTVAMAEPLRFGLVQDLERQTGCRIEQVVAERPAILDAIERSYSEVDAGQEAVARDPHEETPPNAEPVTDVVDRIVAGARAVGATDIHIDPAGRRATVRYRVDGVLQPAFELPSSVHGDLVGHVKDLAGMDAGETRLPQEGRFRAAGDDAIDYRVFTLRTVFGEKIVMHVSDRLKQAPALEEIGLSPAALGLVRRFLRRRRGMILAVGPAGSGRSTTLAAVLKSLSSGRTNTVTLERFIEYQIDGINQMQIDDPLSVPVALRSVLQQDSDVVLVDEIRDADTAKMAIAAASRGPLVLSALSADNAPACVTRLIELGAEPQAIAAALVGVIGQRLVRRLCVHCRKPHTLSPETLGALDVALSNAGDPMLYEAAGCDQCSYTGYRGRVGVFEVMGITDPLRRLIASGASEEQICQAAINGGMVLLAEDGLAKAKSGITSAAELLRAAGDVRELRPLCPGCGTPVGADFSACPACGSRLGSACPHCGRGLQPGWSFCPYCARSVTEARRATGLRDRQRNDKPRGGPPANVAEFKK